MTVDRENKQKQLDNLIEERNATMIIYLMLFVISVVFALMSYESLWLLIPFGMSGTIFGCVWNSLVNQFNKVDNKRLELK